MLFYRLKEYIITYSIIMFYNIISDTVVYISIGPYQCESISPFLKLAIALLRLIYSLFTIYLSSYIFV